MNILLAAATYPEIEPLIRYLGHSWESPATLSFVKGEKQIHMLITGVGMVAATYHLTRVFSSRKFDFALQAGIAGSFNREISKGELAFVSTELFADMGAEDHYNFRDIFELNLGDPERFPFKNRELVCPPAAFHGSINLKRLKGLTVNCVAGTSFTAQQRQKKYACDLESMEGAAFHYVCLNEGIPFAQVRSVSNYVEARDKSQWKIREAIRTLNHWLIDFLEKLPE